jgi:phosphoglycolate phosphatase
MPKPTAFLDLDGPILDVSERHYRVYADLCTHFGGKPIGPGEFWSAKRSKTPDLEILGNSRVSGSGTEYKVSKLNRIEAPEYLRLDRLQAGAGEVLVRLAERYRIVLVTLRHRRDALLAELGALGIATLFADILSAPAGAAEGWEVKCGLVREAGIAPGAQDFFAGDTETDIIAGKALGVSTVAVCDGIRNESFLRALSPDWIIPTLSGLTHTTLLR